MVRKIAYLVSVIGLIGAILCAPVQAATHQVYEGGNISSTYLTYFKDTISGAPFNSDYVAFRSSENTYTLVYGDLEYQNNEFFLVGEKCTEVNFFIDESSQFRNVVKMVSFESPQFSLINFDNIIYSNLGGYPQLVERGANYEMFTALVVCIALLCIVVGRFFRRR